MRTIVAAVILCAVVLLFASPPASVAAPALMAIERPSSTAGPIFRTQPAAPQPQPISRSDDSIPSNLPQQSNNCTTPCKDVINLPPLEIQPSTCKNASDAHYYDYADEYDDDYGPGISYISYILLLTLVFLMYLKLYFYCISKMKKVTEKSACLQSSDNFQYSSED